MEKNLTEEDRDRIVKEAAFKIISLLDGMSLCDAIRAGDLAKLIIKTAHRVNAQDAQIMGFRQEFENAPSK